MEKHPARLFLIRMDDTGENFFVYIGPYTYTEQAVEDPTQVSFKIDPDEGEIIQMTDLDSLLTFLDGKPLDEQTVSEAIQQFALHPSVQPSLNDLTEQEKAALYEAAFGQIASWH